MTTTRIGLIESSPYALVNYDEVVYGAAPSLGGFYVDHYELRDDGLHHVKREYCGVEQFGSSPGS